MKIWYVGIYARVSTTKDEQKDSIQTQIQSLQEWIRKSNQGNLERYEVVKTFQDHGISGATFERDDFDEMKKYIEQGKINMVLTRDLSRLGRNYILAGYYLEDYFKINNIRFVSVLDHVDTVDEINDIVPFKNVLNEMYIKDCSRRSRDGLKQRMIRGSYIGSKPPYGYMKMIIEENGQKTIKLVPAEDETTVVVKEIFQLYLKGWGYTRIANQLNDREIPSPASRIGFPLSKWYRWNENGVKSILTNPKYGGIMVQGQYKKISYKLKKTVKLPQENWIYSGEFQGIVSKDVFLKVQEEMENRRSSGIKKQEKAYLFSHKIICGDCGGAMGYQKKYQGYRCINGQRGGNRCTSHSIKEDFLLLKIKEDIQSYSEKLKIEKTVHRMDFSVNKKKEGIQVRLTETEDQLKRIEGKLKKLYEDRLEEHISKELFLNFSKEIEEKRKMLLKKKDLLQEQLTSVNHDMDQWREGLRERIKELFTFKKPTNGFIDKLIKEIIVFESKDKQGRIIEIHYKFRDPV
ncbi:recombinase family protein [Geosporobacter ferrireducens]|uniref:Recombinase n=1 Tax=Geosporobacter ferrireducens TaxID=1424294 RepID=A0A1D8GN95_9FIRM|nr:recombinase family protein [Geosporobacter ferrireducens]AOT72363.1 hypothetical protein Gferi_24125 [Geosporobacter ferrireducens]